MTRGWILCIVLTASVAAVHAERARVVRQPVVETPTARTAIIRWTANTAGGTPKHYGVVRYGTDRKKLDRTAESPIKWSKANAPNVTYRVRIDGLEPRTTYYYVVDARQADRRAMRLQSRVHAFTTNVGR